MPSLIPNAPKLVWRPLLVEVYFSPSYEYSILEIYDSILGFRDSKLGFRDSILVTR